MSKRIAVRSGYIYSTIFVNNGTISAGGHAFIHGGSGYPVYWKAPQVEYVEISDDYALTAMHSDDNSGIAPGITASYMGAPFIPAGWLRCNGKTLSKEAFMPLYRALYETGMNLNDSGDTFTLPDTRGMFERDMDDGANKDPDTARTIGSVQECGAPNISGSFYAGGAFSSFYGTGYGAFYSAPTDTSFGRPTVGQNGTDLTNGMALSAARSSSVYKAGLTEVRPVNFTSLKIIKY